MAVVLFSKTTTPILHHSITPTLELRLIGYTTDVNWMLSLLTDMLFLHRFYRDDNPWRNLRKIYQSVINDFKPASEIGWTLIENKRKA